MNFAERIIKRIALASTLSKNYGLARPIDVDFCYRLYLNRTPTKEEAAFWHDAIKRRQMSIETLTLSFAKGPEFAAF